MLFGDRPSSCANTTVARRSVVVRSGCDVDRVAEVVRQATWVRFGTGTRRHRRLLRSGEQSASLAPCQTNRYPTDELDLRKQFRDASVNNAGAREVASLEGPPVGRARFRRLLAEHVRPARTPGPVAEVQNCLPRRLVMPERFGGAALTPMRRMERDENPLRRRDLRAALMVHHLDSLMIVSTVS